MKLPKDFPHRLHETKVIFATRPKCPSLISDIDTRVVDTIDFYALAQSNKGSKVCLFSLDNHFKVLGHSFFPTIEEAMNSLEPNGITRKDWKVVKSLI